MNMSDLDELDRRLMDVLGEDARLSNRSLGRRLGVAEGTIRVRIKRLMARRLLRFTAITDNRQHGSPILAFIRVRADPVTVDGLAASISQMRDIRSVIVTLGSFNLLVIGLFENEARLVDTASDHIIAMEGVRAIETSVVVQSLKYNERMAKLNI